jgi:TrmH family RNA methyltransferase
LRELAGWAAAVTVLPDALFAGLGGLGSPAAIGFVIDAPAPVAIDPLAASVVLDRVQDAGNVGSVLRSAAALGVTQVLALTGTAGLWSPKVLRAGMGAHFALRLVEGLEADDLAALAVPLVATSSHTTSVLHQVMLPSPCAWVFGHEGQGVSAALLARCALTVTIPQPGGEESLNVAAAAAICLYEAARQQS